MTDGPLARAASSVPRRLSLPALSTAHSHAFQRAMRGRGQRPKEKNADDFWTWRGQMYRTASELTPESYAKIARVAFRELRAAGVRTVGEFHYIHHQADGTPYDDRTLMSDVVIEAARGAGLRIALLRCAYARAGHDRAPEPGQRRFCDPTPDAVLADVDALRKKYAGHADVMIGLAPHSVRAVPPAWLPVLAEYARRADLPLHMHVAEQTREIEECLAETGRRPLELCNDHGMLGPRFVAVHATHLLPHEAKLLGDATGFACICPTTERDLGDGLADFEHLRSSGVRLCTGIDSHTITDPIEELRSLETHERLRRRSRVTFAPDGSTPAEQLWKEGSQNGALAVGFADAGGAIMIDLDHPQLALVEPGFELDAIVFGASSAVVVSD